jgi:hypothetical protein
MAVQRGCERCRQVVDTVASALHELGLDVIAVAVEDPQAAIRAERPRFDVVDLSSNVPHPDPAAFLDACSVTTFRVHAPALGPDGDRASRHAQRQAPRSRGAAARRITPTARCSSGRVRRRCDRYAARPTPRLPYVERHRRRSRSRRALPERPIVAADSHAVSSRLVVTPHQPDRPSAEQVADGLHNRKPRCSRSGRRASPGSRA